MKYLTTVLFMVTGGTLVGAHLLALQFFLYWHFWWFDIMMHFLGGVLIALTLFTLYEVKFRLPRRWLRPFRVTLFVLVVGLAWEYFELSAGIFQFANIDSLDPWRHAVEDTVIDLVMDVLGGLIGWWVGWSLLTVNELSDNETTHV